MPQTDDNVIITVKPPYNHCFGGPGLKQEIEQIMADPKNPYFDSSHRDHKSMVERMRQLHEKVYGN